VAVDSHPERVLLNLPVRSGEIDVHAHEHGCLQLPPKVDQLVGLKLAGVHKFSFV